MNSLLPEKIPETIRIAVRENYDIDGAVQMLDGERDLNLLLTDRASGNRFVLKVFSNQESAGFIQAEIAAHQSLAAANLPVPRIVLTNRNTTTFEIELAGQTRLARMVTFLPGNPLALHRTVNSDSWYRIGMEIGRLQNGLNGFDHPAAHRQFHWDLRQGSRVVRELIESVADAEWRKLLLAIVEKHDERESGLASAPEDGIVHGDLNDWNLLVSCRSTASPDMVQLTGIIDFGDMTWSQKINDLAIALAYSVLDRPNMLRIVMEITAGYHAVSPLTDSEVDLLWDRVRLRLASSAAIAARQMADHPTNSYLGISQDPIRRTLPQLVKIPGEMVAAAIRLRCGLSTPRSIVAATDWLESGQHRFSFPLEGFDRSGSMVIDWSAASGLFDGSPELLPASIEETTAQLMKASPDKVALGRWGEPRLVYQSSQFQTSTAEAPRTIHLGMDFFAPAGTGVIAADEGVVFAVGNIQKPLDYGGVIIIEYRDENGFPIKVLYGHLDPDSVSEWKIGQPVRSGQTIARLGDRTGNGGWLPHLHLQVISDDFGMGIDFPGVCPPDWQSFWLAVSPNPARLAGIDPNRIDGMPRPTEQLVKERLERIGKSVRLSYSQPIQMVRGWMQYLYDESGRRFIDAYNNVPHVGHCHPKIIEAATRQMRLLNSNTRYVSRLQVEYAKRLASTMPSGLEVCFIVNSASEANELALRLARAATGGRDMIVNENAYHGHTTSLIDISPYKHNGRGGEGPPDWVHAIPVPDVYRGDYRPDDPLAGRKFAAFATAAIERIASRGGKLAGFIAETCPSVGGQIIPPTDYLPEVYRIVRAAGGVCIADEVQTGFGRMGDCYYAFEKSDVVPDMVILGKPIGNGHPMAALVTTRDIADSFDNGMEYFSTFGGNHVSCAVGLAVLDVIESEGLQEHARVVGEHLRSSFTSGLASHPLVGDIRGSGFFWGIDLVRDRATREPATDEAGWIKNQLRHRGILIGTDGAQDNVLKIRPPMPFNISNAETLAVELQQLLAAFPA